VIGKNKRKMSAKRVSFHKKLIQDSPVHKSRPRELLSMIKIGAIFCPLTTNSCNVLRKFSISSDYERDVQANSDVLASHKPNGAHCVASSSVVPVQTVFKRLERDLDINGNNFLATNSLQPKHYNEVKLPQGERFNFNPNLSTRLCFRCLSPNHLIWECRSDIRCIYCFTYGHRA